MTFSRFILASFMLFTLLVLGCSGTGKDSIQPASMIDPIPVNSETQSSQHSLLSTWTAEFNLDKLTAEVIQSRHGSLHYNPTPYLPWPTVVVNSYDTTTGIIDIDLTIENTFPVDVYDARLIIYTDNVGHMLQDPDNWTALWDIPGGYPINPFKTYFDSGQPNRVFPGETSLTENMRIFLPAGNTNVPFAIDASLFTNCEEPYEIADFTQATLWDYNGATAEISVTAFDWGDNINSVEMYCPWITGGANVELSDIGGNRWQGTIVNEVPAPAGDYPGIIIALSEDSGSIALYDWVTIGVSDINILFVDDDNTSGPWDGSPDNPFRYVQDAVDAALDDTTIWIKPGIYREDEGGTGGDAEITILGKSDLFIYGEGTPIIELHTPSGPFRNGLSATDCPGLTVEGLEFKPTYLYGSTVRLHNCPDATIRNCTATPVQGFMEFFRATNCDNLVVEKNIINGFESSSTSSYLFSVWDSDNARVSENICLNHYHQAGNVYYTTMVYLNIRDCNYLEISKNIFGDYNRQCGSENWVQLELITAQNGTGLVIRNNLFYDLSFENTFSVDAESHNFGIQCTNIADLEIFNNTIDSFGKNNPGVGESYAMSLVNCPEALVYNNIVSNISAPAMGVAFGIKSDNPCSVDYSDVWNLIGGTTTPFGNLAVIGPGTFELDPMFTDPQNDIYTLIPGSPCEGTGLGGYDMGCYGGVDPL